MGFLLTLSFMVQSLTPESKLDKRWKLFSSSVKLHHVGFGSCNSLLPALASHGYINYANKIFDEMLVRGVSSFSTLCFGVFIWRFCKDAIFEIVLDLRAKVRQDIFEINDPIDVAGRVLDEFALEELRNRGCKSDFMAYRVLAVGLRSMGYLAEVEVVLKKKTKAWRRIEIAKELGRVIVDGDFPIEDDALNALASSVSTIDPFSAFFFLQCMIGKERIPTLLALSNFGKNLCDNGKTDELVEILKKLSSYGYFIDLEAYNVMVSLLWNAGKVKELISKNGLNPDITLYNDLMDALCRDDLLRPARKLWDEMFASGINGNMQTYTILIKKFSEVGQFEEALVLFNHMLEKGFTPDALTYRSLLESLIQDGKIEPATQIFQKTVEQDQNLPGMLLTPLLNSAALACTRPLGVTVGDDPHQHHQQVHEVFNGHQLLEIRVTQENLSDLDQNVAVFVWTVYSFKSGGDDNEAVARVVRTALSEVLVKYYPLAGRLGISLEGKLVVGPL
ncbi:LOW QUALITY PROTEIN: hypothetical protein V2J09_021904 [Rumex salicifolius]